MKMVKKIYISACGIGLGHARRMEALANELIKRGYEVFFSSYSLGYEYLCEKFDSRIVLKSPGLELMFREDGTFDFHNLMSRRGIPSLFKFIAQIGKEIAHLINVKPNLVISDSRLSTIIASWILRIPSIVVINQVRVVIPRARPMGKLTKFIKWFAERVFMEVLLYFWRRGKLIVIPDYPPPYTISRDNILGIRQLSNMRLIGPLINSFPEKRSLVSGYIVTILSGSLPERLFAHKSLLPALIKLSEKYRVIEIIGLGGHWKINKNNLTIFGRVNDVRRFLEKAEIVILTGGQTAIAEVLKAGVPMILVPPKGHTEKVNNSKSIVKLGIGKLIFMHEVEDKLLNAVEDISRSEVYKRKAKFLANRLKVFDGICELINIGEKLLEK